MPINLKEKIPQTLIEAIEIIYYGLDEQEFDYIGENGPSSGHHSSGMAIRNNWGLWQENSPIVNDIKNTYKIFGHADDCSGLIMAGVYALIKKLPLKQELEKQAEKYKIHWIKEGLNPKTGKQIYE